MMFGMNSQEIEEWRTQKDSVIFLVDCHKSMHQLNPHNGADQQSNIEQILRAAHSFVKTKIISNENDKVGIILYGCGKDGAGVANQNPLKFKNIHVLYNLDIPDASLIKTLENKASTFTDDHGFFDEGSAATNSRAAEAGDQINSTSMANHMGSSSLANVSSLVSQDKSNSQFASTSVGSMSEARSPLF